VPNNVLHPRVTGKIDGAVFGGYLRRKIFDRLPQGCHAIADGAEFHPVACFQAQKIFFRHARREGLNILDG